MSIANYCARNVSSGTAAPSVATNVNNRWDSWRCGSRVGLVERVLACRWLAELRWPGCSGEGHLNEAVRPEAYARGIQWIPPT